MTKRRWTKRWLRLLRMRTFNPMGGCLCLSNYHHLGSFSLFSEILLVYRRWEHDFRKFISRSYGIKDLGQPDLLILPSLQLSQHTSLLRWHSSLQARMRTAGTGKSMNMMMKYFSHSVSCGLLEPYPAGLLFIGQVDSSFSLFLNIRMNKFRAKLKDEQNLKIREDVLRSSLRRWRKQGWKDNDESFRKMGELDVDTAVELALQEPQTSPEMKSTLKSLRNRAKVLSV